MQHPIKKHFYYIPLLLLLIISACRCKKDNSVTPPPPPDPPKDIYLVTAIRVNNVPKDSFAYNDLRQITEKWDYNTTYRKWQNYIAYTYRPDGYVAAATYYNEIEYNVKSLTQKDSLVWSTNNITTYTTFYRELGTAISGYDTTRQFINDHRQLTLEGSKDTIPLVDILGGVMVAYTQYAYQNNNLTQFVNMNYLTIRNGPPSLVMSKYDIIYTTLKNPLYPPLSKNPHLLRSIIGEQFPNTSNDYYPYLVSEHLLGSMQYATENTPLTTTIATYTWVDTSFSPQTQVIPRIDKSISYSYKIIKAP